MIKLIRWLRGFVVFELRGKFPERFINVCVRLGVSLFDPLPCGDHITGAMLLCDYKNIRSIARKCGVTLRVKERYGLPFLLSEYRSRSGLLAGAAAFVAIVIVMQSFVWTVEIHGLDTVSAVDFRDTLKAAGVNVGAFKGSLDLQAIQRKVMQDVEEIGWMSINIIGTKAEVEVKEKDKKPEIQDANVPCNIKASTDGIVLSMNVKNGKAVVPVGSAVKKGQLLVSGVVENSLQNINYVQADAQITANTTREADFEVKLNGEYKAVADSALRHRFDFLWFSLPVTFDPVNGEYSTRVVRERVILNNTEVPCGRSSQYCSVYKNKEYIRDDKSREAVVTADESLYRLFAFNQCESVDIVKQTPTLLNNVYRVTVQYTCTEEIGVHENIVVN